MLSTIVDIFSRDLDRLKNEISLFKKEENLWVISGNINNSAGNLCLHLCGNLKHFIGSILGQSGYIREREKEFSSRDKPIDEIHLEIEETLSIVTSTLKKMKSEELQREYPVNVFGEVMTTEYFLIHLISHLNYHLGQINYLRRIIE